MDAVTAVPQRGVSRIFGGIPYTLLGYFIVGYPMFSLWESNNATRRLRKSYK